MSKVADLISTSVVGGQVAQCMLPALEPRPGELYLLWQISASEYFTLNFTECALAKGACTCRTDLCPDARLAVIGFVSSELAAHFVDLAPGQLAARKLRREQAIEAARLQSADCLAIQLRVGDWWPIIVESDQDES